MFRCVTSVLCCLAITGCGSGLNTALVSGVITLDGQALANASVTFTPEASDGDVHVSNGRTDTEGKYSLKVTATDDNGAVLGKHKVTIALIGDNNQDDDSVGNARDTLVPSHDFTFEVTAAGSESANFDLKKSE